MKKKRANLKSLEIRRQIIDEAKSEPCADCHEEYALVCMDLHHPNGDGFSGESGSFSRWAMSVGVDKLKEEIAKCEVLCANCHRIRHFGNGES